MKVLKTTFPDVVLLEHVVREDDRGFLMETFRARQLADMGISGPFVQENHSGSRQGVLRGLHFQLGRPQGKLVRVIAGEVYDVAVDLRRSSPTFLTWSGFRLSAESRLELWLPAGFAHGFYVLTPWAEVVYKLTEYYDPDSEHTLIWNDPDLDIEWPMPPGEKPLLSEKDARGKRLREIGLLS